MARFGSIPTQLDLTASQSVRRNSADDGFEAFIAAAVGQVVWSRTGTTLHPTTAGDNVQIDGGTLTVNTIGEYGAGVGVTVDSLLIRDQGIGATTAYQGHFYFTNSYQRIDGNLFNYKRSYSNTSGEGVHDICRRYGGTIASPAAAPTGGYVRYDRSYGYDGTNDREVARCATRLTGTIADDNISGYFLWSIRPTGVAEVLTTFMTLTENALCINNISEYAGGAGVTVDTMLLKDYVISCSDGSASNGQPITIKAGDPEGAGNDGGSVTLKAGNALAADSASTPGGVYLMPGNPYQTSITSQVFLGDNTYNADVIGIQSNGSQTNVDLALSTKGAGKISLLSASIYLWNLRVYDTASVMYITPANSTYAIDILGAAGETDTDGNDVTVRGGAGNGTGDGGDLFLRSGVGGGSGVAGNIYFGTGVAGTLPARVAETNAVFYDTTTGKLSYGAAAGGSSNVSVADQGDNRMITCTNTADALQAEAKLTFDGNELKFDQTLVGTNATLSLYHTDNTDAGSNVVLNMSVAGGATTNIISYNDVIGGTLGGITKAGGSFLYAGSDSTALSLVIDGDKPIYFSANNVVVLKVDDSGMDITGRVDIFAGGQAPLVMYGENADGVRITTTIVDASGYATIYAYDDNDSIPTPGFADLYLGTNVTTRGIIIAGATGYTKMLIPYTVQNYAMLCDSNGNITRTLVSGSPSTDFLRGDGTWATPAGSGAGNPAGSDHHVQFNDNGSFGGNADFQWVANQWVNINQGTRDTSERLHVHNDTNYTYAQLIRMTSTNAHGLWIKASGQDSGTYALAIQRNVPSSTEYIMGVVLDGRIFMRGYSSQYTLLVQQYTSTGHGIEIDMTAYTSGAYYAIKVYESTDTNAFTLTGAGDAYIRGDVGIGGTNATAKLYVYHNTSGQYAAYFNQDHATGHGIRVDIDATSGDTYTLFRGYRSTTKIAELRSDGKWWAVDYIHSSDRRLKNIYARVDNGLDIVMKLNPVTYRWKDKRDDNIHIGFIAQEVQKVRSELVNIDSDGFLSLSYAKMSALAIAGVQGLNRKVDSIEDKLRKEIIDLKIRVKELEDGKGS